MAAAMTTAASAATSAAAPALEPLLRQAARAVREADALLFTSGAGLGVDSGLPDFRGVNGFWRAYPPMQKLGLRFEEMSNPAWFARDPALAWGFWMHRIKLYRETAPHKGFEMMLRWGREKEATGKKRGFFVFTSNVDGAFVKAGYAEEKLYECHGSSRWLQCLDSCRSGEIWPSLDINVSFSTESFRAEAPFPACKHCGKMARPNVLMFGDWGFDPLRTQAQEERFDAWQASLDKGDRLVVVEIGAGKAVPTVRLTSEHALKRQPLGTLIRVNPADFDSPMPDRTISLPMGGLAALARIEELMREA